MRDDLSGLAEGVDAGAEPEPETVNGLFRSAHSLKGLAGMFGLDAMSELAHHLEDVLDRLRMGRTALGKDGLALFDDAVSLIAQALQQVGEDDPSLAESIVTLLDRIDGWNRQPTAEVADERDLDVPDSMLRTLTEYEEHRLGENLRRGLGIYVVDVDFELSCFEVGLAEVSGAIREVGEVLSTLPSPAATPDSHIRFSLLTATALEAAELAPRLDLSPQAIRIGRLPEGTVPTAADVSGRAPAEAGDEVGAEASAGSSEVADAGDPTLKSISDTVRVDIRKLDELMNLVGELAVQRGSLKSLAQELRGRPDTAQLGAQLEKVHKGLERKLQELQAGVLEVRMVPLRQVFDKLSRVVRRLRIDLGKEVRLEIAGADTELDKLIVEELIDPLMHVVRNAFDHAIEAADERTSVGKDVEGLIRIEASQRGNDVVIAVRDDGRGIDVDRVRAIGERNGLLAPDANPSRKEILDILFTAGFSTREEVTGTSGRGVGMDVVRSNIGALGGLVDIDSALGRGTTITFTLPITLAIIRALFVGVGEQRFAIPLNAIRETLIVDPEEIQRSDGRELLNLRGDPLLLRRLAQEFDVPVEEGSKQFAVVLGMGDAQLGLIVDRLDGQQDAVIKPIQGPVRKVRGIAGATELGDQGAVLVLDASALIEDALRRGDGS
jgi:two-component system chemotaxis sensor kinase CheA